jgi:hypothetical protein
MPRDMDEEMGKKLTLTEVKLPELLQEVDDEVEVRSAFSGEDTGEVDLDWFVGKTFELTGVGQEQVRLKTSYGSGEESTHFSFVLNGNCYTAIEDPSDGYRSSLNRLALTKGTKITNRFLPVKVTGRRGEAGYYKSDLVELVDEVTGKTVIEFGTSNTDDYYPSFVGNFQPANMVLNETPEHRKERDDAEFAKTEQERMDAQRTEVLTDNGWGSW